MREGLHSTRLSQASHSNSISDRVRASEISEVKSCNGANSYDSVASVLVYVPAFEVMPVQGTAWRADMHAAIRGGFSYNVTSFHS